MIYKISDSVVIDSYGYRVINSDGSPLNYFQSRLEGIKSSDVERALLYVSTLKRKKATDIPSLNLLDYLNSYLYSNGYIKEGANISNGALIVAMLQSGFKYKKIFLSKGTSIYLEFNVLLSSIE